MRFLLLTLGLCAGAAPARADVLPPGHASVGHSFEVRGLGKAPEGTRFFAYPTDMSGGLVELESGVPFRFYKFAHPRIYACTGPLPVPEDRDDELDLPRSEVALHEVSSVPSWRKTRRIRTVYEFEGIEGERVVLALSSETHYDGSGREVSARGVRLVRYWPALPVLGLLGLAVIGFRRIRRRSEP